MNKKLLIIPTLLLLLTGCGEVAKLNITTTEPITIDATEKLDPSIYVKNLVKNAPVVYDINVPVQVNEPKVSIDRHITVDKYVGYDLEQYIHEDEGVTHTTNFDEDTGKLSVTFTKGEWSTTLEDDVTVLDSNPLNVWPKTYTCCMSIQKGCNYITVLNEDNTFSQKLTIADWNDTGKYTYNGDNSWYFDYNNSTDQYANGNYNQFVITNGKTMSGIQAYTTCTLNK